VKAGIQMIQQFPTQWDKTLALSASQCFLGWIPAFAGMTAYWIIWVKALQE
jgi:hypothetical protein